LYENHILVPIRVYTGGLSWSILAIMQRVNVIGAPGAGKSTLGVALAEHLQGQLIELDALFWGPDWQPTAREEFRAKVGAALAAERWIVCGDYNSSARDIIWQRADTVVWLDYSLRLTFYRLFHRTLRRIVTHEELWGGNRESWRAQFLSRQSLFLYLLRTHRRRRRENEASISSGRNPHLQVLRFRRPGETQAWLDSLSESAPSATTG
jgi:adenylate kinase family enzyme